MINFSEIYFENVDTIKMEITGTNLKMWTRLTWLRMVFFIHHEHLYTIKSYKERLYKFPVLDPGDQEARYDKFIHKRLIETKCMHTAKFLVNKVVTLHCSDLNGVVSNYILNSSDKRNSRAETSPILKMLCRAELL
jgi:hypothetical protein